MSRTPRFNKRQPGLGPWCATITTCPSHVWHCRCKDEYPQAIVDVWSLTHVVGGIITGITTYWIGWLSLILTVGIAILWELFENSMFGVKVVGWIWNDDTYIGDHMWNSIFDVICNAIGGFITAIIMIEAGWTI